MRKKALSLLKKFRNQYETQCEFIFNTEKENNFVSMIFQSLTILSGLAGRKHTLKSTHLLNNAYYSLEYSILINIFSYHSFLTT